MSNSHDPLGAGPHTRLDAAIDRAVRAVMRGEPRPGLRGRVLARLDSPPRRTLIVPRWMLAPMGAAAGVLITLLVLRPGAPVRQDMAVTHTAPVVTAPSRPEPAIGAAAQPSTPPAASARRPPVASASVTSVRDRGPRRERLPQPPRMDAVFGQPVGRVAAASIAPDAPVEPEPETAAALPSIAVRPIVISPLGLGPIQIVPLPIRK